MSILVTNLTDMIVVVGDLPPGSNTLQPYESIDFELVYTRTQVSNSVVLKSLENHHAVNVVMTGTPEDPLSQIAADSLLAKENTTSEFTYVQIGDSKGEVATAKEYPTGSAAGASAKLNTFEYADPTYPKKATKITVTDTTV